MKKTRILITTLWPWGGLRTFLLYNFRYFPKDRYEITILANPTFEKEQFEIDMRAAGMKTVWAQPFFGKNLLFLRAFNLLKKNRYDLIHSQDYIAASHIYLINRIFRIPHLLTVHGSVYDHYFRGFSGRLKKLLFRKTIGSLKAAHGVGNDVLEHFKKSVPEKYRSNTKWVVIKNGIDIGRFSGESPDAGRRLREESGIAIDKFIFGFFGRFTPQKGFNHIIDAVAMLVKSGNPFGKFVVLTVGSGDDSVYSSDISRKSLSDYFRFLEFRPDISEAMKGCDAILMPSIFEGLSLLACEVLCAGVPLIASDCLGLGEVVINTPAIVIPTGESKPLASAMAAAMTRSDLKKEFETFKAEAAERFDVAKSAAKLKALIDEISSGQTQAANYL